MQQIQAEQKRRDEEAEEQLREQEEEQEDLKHHGQAKNNKEGQEAKELVVLQNGEEVPAHQVLDVDTVVITQDPQGNLVRTIKHE